MALPVFLLDTQLERQGWPDVVFAFHDRDEIGPKMLARIAKVTELTPNTETSRRLTLIC